jgi:asparagine synthase (glutamine-hydrolysing)
MCGIAGILELDPRARPSRDALRRMSGVLTHRGPDAEGFWESGPVGLAHRRLSIIDVASGQQPMESPDGQVCVVFNGEIYNYPELRRDLESRGHVFRTKSDTEVLLALYCADGIESFSRLNGMFACAFWDRRTARLVLVRDRFGKKPLFYRQDAHRLLFGSELKALLAYGPMERAVNLRAVHEYLTYGYIVGEAAILEGVQRVPPAHVVVIHDGQVTSRPYWQLRYEPVSTPPDEAETVARVEDLLRQAVKRRLMSEVPLGAFLSGGLDSSTVVALMAEVSSRPVRTFSIGFEEQDYSELADARRVADHLGTDHHEMIVKPAALDVLPDLVWHLDEPFGDSSALATYYVCQAARQHVTVALSGDGGDEVFAGYGNYQNLERWNRLRRIPAWVRRGPLASLSRALPFTWPGWNALYAAGQLTDDGLPPLAGMYPYIHESLWTSEAKARLGSHDPFETTRRLAGPTAHLDIVSRLQYLDTLQYLPADILTKVDRMSMAHSLEVRSPLLDHTLVEYAATLPVSLKLRGTVGKYVLRRVAARLLPPEVLTKPKQGFAIPKDRWFRGELRSFAEDVLLDRRSLWRGYLRKDTLTRMLHHHATGRRDYSTWIWCLIVLELWSRRYLDGTSVEAAR